MKKAHGESKSDYGRHEDEEKSAKGSNYGKAGHFKKGFKTTGFSKGSFLCFRVFFAGWNELCYDLPN